jgi:hypothetical protein
MDEKKQYAVRESLDTTRKVDVEMGNNAILYVLRMYCENLLIVSLDLLLV